MNGLFDDAFYHDCDNHEGGCKYDEYDYKNPNGPLFEWENISDAEDKILTSALSMENTTSKYKYYFAARGVRTTAVIFYFQIKK